MREKKPQPRPLVALSDDDLVRMAYVPGGDAAPAAQACAELAARLAACTDKEEARDFVSWLSMQQRIMQLRGAGQ